MPPDSEIQGLIDLVSNTMDAYTTVLFRAKTDGGDLRLYAYQSLSRNIDHEVEIRAGDGLIGWVYKNGQPVTVDQFEHDTRRLLFYKVDESIKSFMAVPLPQIRGVLAVDSKQRYVFTEKSQKILHQFGQALETVWIRINRARQNAILAEATVFSADLEQILSERLETTRTIPRLLNLIQQHTGASVCFLTALIPGVPDRFFILGHNSPTDLRLGRDSLSVENSLTGLVIQKGQSLVIDKWRSDTEKSFIFKREESLRKYTSFAGFPLIWDGRSRGALILLGEQSLGFDEHRKKVLEMAASRLAASVKMEFLFQRVSELGRLDSQVGLPHRTFFVQRLTRMLQMASVQVSSVTLILLDMVNLGQVATKYGQEAAQEVLRTAAHQLLASCRPEHELGHVSYGRLAVAMIGLLEIEARKIIEEFTSAMADWPLENTQGRVQIKILHSLTRAPAEANSAETLLQTGLDKLARTST
ncbi:MAG: GAF domain-containing protein [Deltaproteobacteria bacterium]|nr:GAF domain-containing protein [Deltaproteobacteria bacterium]